MEECRGACDQYMGGFEWFGIVGVLEAVMMYYRETDERWRQSPKIQKCQLPAELTLTERVQCSIVSDIMVHSNNARVLVIPTILYL
jgi:hypothetical protein